MALNDVMIFLCDYIAPTISLGDMSAKRSYFVGPIMGVVIGAVYH